MLPLAPYLDLDGEPMFVLELTTDRCYLTTESTQVVSRDMGYDFTGLPGRIQEARENAGISRENLGKFVGGLSRQAVARWERRWDQDRNSVPDLETLEKIANALRVDFLWLLTGQRFALDVESEEGGLIPVYRLEDFHLKTAPLFHKRTLAPVKEETNGFRVSDLSNSPEYKPGDIVVTEPCEVPQPGAVMVARLIEKRVNIFGRCVIGGYNTTSQAIFEIVPFNEAFPRFSSNREQIELLAVVIEHHRSLRGWRAER
jgi:transcriptional regulator with XRE-family HTH domain